MCKSFYRKRIKEKTGVKDVLTGFAVLESEVN